MCIVWEKVAIREQSVRSAGKYNIMQLQLSPNDLMFIVAFRADWEQEGGKREKQVAVYAHKVGPCVGKHGDIHKESSVSVCDVK